MGWVYTGRVRQTVAFLVVLLASLLLAGPAQAKTGYYVSLGDSYASGYQPDRGNTRDGFVYQAQRLARAKGYKLKVVNFACAGATTKSMVSAKGCPKGRLGPGAKSYKSTQLAAALSFIKKNRKQVKLITVSIGGNDVTACVRASEPIPCVGNATTAIKGSVSSVATKLRKAAGPKALMIGTTYPDVVLGGWVNPGSAGAKELANLSVFAFKSLINPALAESYAKGGARFVDVTAATGAYGDMSQLTELAPYGSIPTPVADVCKLTWYCAKGDIHANSDGYALIARLVVAELP